MFKSHEEADEADRQWYASLTPDERVALVVQMIDDFKGLYPGLEPKQNLKELLDRWNQDHVFIRWRS